MKLNFQKKSDEELFLIMKSNSNDSKFAFDEIYNRYNSRIYTYCRKILNHNPIADDVFQETFTKFYESASKNIEMTNVIGYLIKIARNMCLTEKKKLQITTNEIDEFSFPSYDRSYENKQLMDIFEATLDLLPDSYREIIIMKEYLNLSYSEIAEALNISSAVVRVRIFRSKNKIRELLNPYLEELNNF